MSSLEEKVKLPPTETISRCYQPQGNRKVIRILTVAVYVLCVSLAAIMLSLYYIFIWDPTIRPFVSKGNNCGKIARSQPHSATDTRPQMTKDQQFQSPEDTLEDHFSSVHCKATVVTRMWQQRMLGDNGPFLQVANCCHHKRCHHLAQIKSLQSQWYCNDLRLTATRPWLWMHSIRHHRHYHHHAWFKPHAICCCIITTYPL